MARSQFGSKIGLIAATVGSAVGLGNIWRFPAETQENGGAAYLLLYIACVFILGLPVMLAEFSLGRGGRSDSIGVFKKLSPGTNWWMVGGISIFAAYFISCFYMVVNGWTIEYLLQSITGNLYAPIEGVAAGSSALFEAKMDQYVNSDWMPLIFTWIAIIVNIAILLGGVQKGIERLSNTMMPLLFVALIALCIVSLTLPGAAEGVKWFLTPDFSKITIDTAVSALGQAFFSLSLGMGALITYASYYPSDAKMTSTSVVVAFMTLLVAVLMGLVIFPAVTSFGLADHSLRGTTLVFQTLPEVFSYLPLTQLWSTLFFVLLLVAAMTSIVSIMEVPVAFFCDRYGISRRKSVIYTHLPLFVLSGLCSLSFGSLSGVEIFGFSIFGFFDYVSANLLLPIGGIGLCIYLGWFAPRDLLKNQLTNEGAIKSNVVGIIQFILRYIAPVIISVILISNLI